MPGALSGTTGTSFEPMVEEVEGKQMQTMQIAILGGGVTGLAAAHALSRRFPAAHILLLESTPRLGGWLQSELVVVHNHNRILVERGPRTLRPQGSAVLDLVRDLHIDHELITVPRTADAARHR